MINIITTVFTLYDTYDETVSIDLVVELYY